LTFPAVPVEMRRRVSRIVPTLAIVTVTFMASCTALLGSSDVPNAADAAGAESGGASSGGDSSGGSSGSGSGSGADDGSGGGDSSSNESAGPLDAAVGDAAPTDAAFAGDTSNDGVAPGQPPSCQGRAGDAGDGVTACGAVHESCCTSPLVTGGTFNRVYTNTGSEPSGEGAQANVSSFRLDKYDVTVGRFRAFVAAWNNGAGWTPAARSGKHTHLHGGMGLVDTSQPPGTYESGWLATDSGNISPTNSLLACDPSYAPWTPSSGANESRPMTCANWYEAYAFCIWDGGFLPSEAEWAYAAAGGMLEREYPWGSVAPGTANQYAIYGCYYQGTGTCTSVANIAPVGTARLGAGYWGQVDLVGNVIQWTLDWLEPIYATPSVDGADLTMPTGLTGAVVRGSSFEGDVTTLDPTGRASSPRGARYYDTTFRCARVP
jgi:sulfatase modifying factor 1